ncbi:MAG: hypothetical protein U0169_04955 [Polyangiaceae bacterium]
MDLHPDFRDLLAEFVRADVRFVVLGGYAVGFHGKPRATKDLDLLVARDSENLERAATALSRFGAPASVVEAIRVLAPDDIVYLGVAPVHVDILGRADGIDTNTTIARADVVRIGDLDVPVISRADLLANKRASGRPQDLADVAVLEKMDGRT